MKYLVRKIAIMTGTSLLGCFISFGFGFAPSAFGTVLHCPCHVVACNGSGCRVCDEGGSCITVPWAG